MEAIGQIEQGALGLLGDGKGLVTLGGDHTISLPLLRAMNKVHGPVALVHFDAHLDTWPTYFGAPYTHGTPFRRAAEEGLFVPGKSAHVGIRGSLYATTDLSDDADLGFQMFNCLDVDRLGVPAIIEKLREQVGDTTDVSVDRYRCARSRFRARHGHAGIGRSQQSRAHGLRARIRRRPHRRR